MSKFLFFISLCFLLAGCQLGATDAATQPETKHLLNNLVVEQDDALTVVREGEAVAIPADIAESVRPSTDFSFAVHFENRYSQQDGDIIVTNLSDGTTQPLLQTPEREERHIWGVVGTWLLVESFPAGQVSDDIGPLAAIDLEGAEMLVVTEDHLSGYPILSPFDHIIYSTASGAFSWHPEEITETMPFTHFLWGSFSPDGIWLAIDTGTAIDIFNMARLVQVASVTPSAAVGGLPPAPIVWHPDADWLAYEFHEGVDRSVYVANLDTLAVKVVTNASDPQFSPDGEWLAVYDLVKSGIKLVNLETNETLAFGINGRPMLWAN